jgi:NAD(P)H-hydrate repair Nnr-like enzyme with NAD(P)H-hydrate dehydratase domain
LAGITGALVARHVKQIGVPDKKRLMFISALALKVLSTAGDLAEQRNGVGSSDIAANIHLATRELAE